MPPPVAVSQRQQVASGPSAGQVPSARTEAPDAAAATTEEAPRARFLRACAEAISSGDTRLAKIAHLASGRVLEDCDTGSGNLADLASARARLVPKQ
jgi:acyl-CoA reductase-like NAD-dependent aldehyde dehydrogenase